MSARATLTRLWHEQRVALIGFTVAMLLVLVFALRMLLAALYWGDPAHHRQDPAPWMTPGYIARSWRLDNHAVGAILGLEQGGRRTLSDIARDRGVPVSALIDELRITLPQLQALPEGADPDHPAAAGQ